MKKVVVFGGNGQDGHFLIKNEIQKKNFVYSITKNKQNSEFFNLNNYKNIKLDITDQKKLQALIRYLKPDLIYFFSAIHGPEGFNYEKVKESLLLVNTWSVETIMEALIKSDNTRCKFVYPSSSKVFLEGQKIISENSNKKSICLYTLSKNLSEEIINYYRFSHNINSSIFWLFNHESLRRKEGYFIHKVAHLIYQLLIQNESHCSLGNLNFWCDWGDASEYMKIISNLSIKKIATDEDFILATGKPTNALNLVCNLCDYFNIESKYFNNKITSNWSSKANIQKLVKLNKTGPKIPAFQVFLQFTLNYLNLMKFKINKVN